MITIKITNVEDVVEKNRGWFVANVVGAFVDVDHTSRTSSSRGCGDNLAAHAAICR